MILLRSFQPSHVVFCAVELFHPGVAGAVVAGDDDDIGSVRFYRQVEADAVVRFINDVLHFCRRYDFDFAHTGSP